MVNTILPVERRLLYINKNYDTSCAKVSGELDQTHANLTTVFVHTLLLIFSTPDKDQQKLTKTRVVFQGSI